MRTTSNREKKEDWGILFEFRADLKTPGSALRFNVYHVFVEKVVFKDVDVILYRGKHQLAQVRYLALRREYETKWRCGFDAPQEPLYRAVIRELLYLPQSFEQKEAEQCMKSIEQVMRQHCEACDPRTVICTDSYLHSTKY